MSIRRKDSKEQCPHKKIEHSNYCGIHKKAKCIVRIDSLVKDEPKCYTPNEILVCPSIEKLSLEKLQNTLNFLGMTKIPGNKKDMYVQLHNYYILTGHIYESEEERKVRKIILLQSFIRGALVRQRAKCINEEDIATLDDKFSIPSRYYFSYTDSGGFKYCFDIRSFIKVLDNNKHLNPYTMVPFEKTVIFNALAMARSLTQKGYSLDFAKEKRNQEQIMEDKMIMIFHKFDMLDNYTDHRWFHGLSLSDLKRLYKICEDIWNYRSQLSSTQKRKIIRNGRAFNIPLDVIIRFKPHQKITLQNILLDEFNRFASEADDDSDKRLGVMLILTALVEVSPSAAHALPHFVQYH